MSVARPRSYLETTIWNFHSAPDAPHFMEATRHYFEEVRRGLHDVYVSDLVLAEIDRAPAPRRDDLMQLVESISPTILPTPSHTETVVARLITEGVIPTKYADDAVHIAIALVNEMDVLLSWNFKHIVKSKTRRMVSGMSRMLGYKEIDICTPLEVMHDA